MKVRVLKPFRDIYTHKPIKMDSDGCVEMSEKRYAEAVENLSKWQGPFLEIVKKGDSEEVHSEEPEKAPAKRGRKKQEE